MFAAVAAAEQARDRDRRVGLHQLVALAEIAVVVVPQLADRLPDEPLVRSLHRVGEQSEAFDHADAQVAALLVHVPQLRQQHVAHTLLHRRIAAPSREQAEPPGRERARANGHLAAGGLAALGSVGHEAAQQIERRGLPGDAERQRRGLADLLVAIGKALVEQLDQARPLRVDADFRQRDHRRRGQVLVVRAFERLRERVGDAVLAVLRRRPLRVARVLPARAAEVELVGPGRDVLAFDREFVEQRVLAELPPHLPAGAVADRGPAAGQRRRGPGGAADGAAAGHRRAGVGRRARGRGSVPRAAVLAAVREQRPADSERGEAGQHPEFPAVGHGANCTGLMSWMVRGRLSGGAQGVAGRRPLKTSVGRCAAVAGRSGIPV